MDLYRALRVQRGDVVALVGGGGKTSAMFRLGDELAVQGWRVLNTTTTHISIAQVAQASNTLILPEIDGDPLAPPVATAITLADKLFDHSPTLVIANIDPATERAIGLRPDIIDRILRELKVDVVINEADGARLRSFKAPADHEPVIPSSTTLVIPVVGMDVLGQPLDAIHVHRPERVATLTGVALGQPVTPEMITAVIIHPQGSLKGIPLKARVMALINKVQTEQELEAARHLADMLLVSPRISAVAVGAVQTANPVHLVTSRVAVVVLAAGESHRFGRLKQLEPWGQGTLLTHAVDIALASGAQPVIVVLGCQAAACRAALGDRPVSVVINPDWAEGQSTSVRAGLSALPANVGAVLFHLADQPGVTPEVMNALIARHAITLAPVVWPEYEGRRGNPVLFDRVAFSELKRLTGDAGGKPVLLAYAQSGVAERVTVHEPGVLIDIDSPQDLP